MSNTNDNNPEHQEPTTGVSPEVLDGILAEGVEAEPSVKPEAPASRNSEFVSPNVTITHNPLGPATEKDIASEFPAHLFRRTDSEMVDDLRGLKNIDPTIGAEGKRWAVAIRGAQKMRVDKALYEASLNDPASAHYQYVQSGAVRAYSRAVESTIGGRFISGARAVSHVRYTLGMGEDREIPLMASGFYVTLRAIPDTELSALETAVLSEKEEIGRRTGGASLSATAVYLVDHTANMILANMVETNVEITRPDELLDLILVTDVQALALGQAQAIFPKGYPIEVPCTRNYEKCQHVERYNLGVRYMAIHDNRKLSEYQRAHIGKPDVKLRVEDVKKYQEDGPVKVSKFIEDEDRRIRIDFRTPTLREYIEDGRGWIDGIVNMVDTIIDPEGDPRHRKREIDDKARLTTLRQYGHFINTITIISSNGESVIKDRESMLNVLSELSAVEDLIPVVAKGVREHIEAATVTTVGVPKTPCPVCEADVVLTEEEKAHPRIVPVDALNLFFTLLSLKLAKRQKTRLQDI